MKPLAMLLSAILIPISTFAIAGPFGFDLKSKTPPKNCKVLDKEIYECFPIKPHQDLDEYGMKYYEGIGICLIYAGKAIRESRYAVKSQDLYRKLVKQLSEKYGKGQDVGGILPNSYWKKPEDFRTSLRERERVVRYEITTVDKSGGINKIIAGIQYDNGHWLDVYVTYFTTVNRDCNEHEAKKEKGVL